MEEELNTYWLKRMLRGFGMLLGLLAMAALLMGFIVGVARIFDSKESSAPAMPVFIGYEAQEQQNARTRTPSPYAPETWPNRPDEPSAFGGRISRIGGGGEVISSRGSAVSPSPPPVPVGISAEEFQSAAAAGKPMYIPDPKGNCDLSGNSQRDLTNCFAERVAR